MAPSSPTPPTYLQEPNEIAVWHAMGAASRQVCGYVLSPLLAARLLDACVSLPALTSEQKE